MVKQSQEKQKKQKKPSVSVCKAKYSIYFRKNLHSSAWYKDGDRPQHLKDVTDNAYAVDWIQQNGDKENVYFVKGIKSGCSDKWVYDETRGWHLTNYRTAIDFTGNNNVARVKYAQSYLHVPMEHVPSCDCGCLPPTGFLTRTGKSMKSKSFVQDPVSYVNSILPPIDSTENSQ